MFVLGLQGSPRKKSNTAHLLSAFMTEAARRGAICHVIDVCRTHIVPCKELIVCEKRGYCPIEDDMNDAVYPLLRQADVVVAATPIFFYNATAQLKALIDRCQTLWARKYRLHLKDPGCKIRQGFLLSVAATSGKSLFDGLELTARYFFDGISARYTGSLTYPRIEHRGDMEKHPTVGQDVKKAVASVLAPLAGRKRILFASRDNRCRSQMAAGFARYFAGDKIDAMCAGWHPASAVDPLMVKTMAEAGMDMAFSRPLPLTQLSDGSLPDRIVAIGDTSDIPDSLPAPVVTWPLPATEGCPIEEIRKIRDEIKHRVRAMIEA